MKNNDSTIKKNQIFTIQIDDMTDLGFGVGRIEGKVVFVSDAVAGDLCEVKIIKVNSSYLIGKIEKLITPSPARSESFCREDCKSCAYRLISYEDEANRKEEATRRLFSSSELSHITTERIITSPSVCRYRNKAQYPIALKGEEYAVGFYAPKTHRVNEVKDCPLSPAVFASIIDELKLFFKENSLSVYNEEDGKGLLRHVYLRRGEVSGEVLLTIVINGEQIPNASDLVDRITKKFPEIVGILLNVNKDDTNVVLGREYKTLYGRDHIFDTLAGVRLKITAPSFYQVNHDCAELLYAKARELAAVEKSDTLLDLYCGAGSIGLSMAKDAGKVIGIEIVESAIECAKFNAELNGITNAEFFVGDAADTEKLLDEAEKALGEKIAPDVIILDPPRAGCDQGLIDFVSRLDPKRIVYISCNPKTLARDVKQFIANGFNCSSVTPVDMFPRTGHVESVVCLTRRLDNELRERMN